MCVVWSHQVIAYSSSRKWRQWPAHSPPRRLSSYLTCLKREPHLLYIQRLTRNCPLVVSAHPGSPSNPVAHTSAWAVWCPSQVPGCAWTVGGSLHSLIRGKYALRGVRVWQWAPHCGESGRRPDPLGGQQHTSWGLLVLFNPEDFRNCFQKNLVAYMQRKIYHLKHSCVLLTGVANIHIVVHLKWSRTI